MNKDDNKISNIGQLFALVSSSKIISYFQLPVSMMGLTQIAAGDFWNDITKSNMTWTWDWGLDWTRNITLPDINTLYIDYNTVTGITSIIIVFICCKTK